MKSSRLDRDRIYLDGKEIKCDRDRTCVVNLINWNRSNQ